MFNYQIRNMILLHASEHDLSQELVKLHLVGDFDYIHQPEPLTGKSLLDIAHDCGNLEGAKLLSLYGAKRNKDMRIASFDPLSSPNPPLPTRPFRLEENGVQISEKQSVEPIIEEESVEPPRKKQRKEFTKQLLSSPTPEIKSSLSLRGVVSPSEKQSLMLNEEISQIPRKNRGKEHLNEASKISSPQAVSKMRRPDVRGKLARERARRQDISSLFQKLGSTIILFREPKPVQQQTLFATQKDILQETISLLTKFSKSPSPSSISTDESFSRSRFNPRLNTAQRESASIHSSRARLFPQRFDKPTKEIKQANQIRPKK